MQIQKPSTEDVFVSEWAIHKNWDGATMDRKLIWIPFADPKMPGECTDMLSTQATVDAYVRTNSTVGYRWKFSGWMDVAMESRFSGDTDTPAEGKAAVESRIASWAGEVRKMRAARDSYY